MIRVVLDTNVIVSGFPAQSGTLRSVIERWRDQEYEFQISAHLLEVIERTWNKPYWRARFSHFERSWALGLLHRRAIRVRSSERVQGVATHPEDDAVLDAVVSGQTDYLVSGDQQLLKLGDYRGVT